MNDQDRRHAADELGDGFTRLANALGHVDRRRTTLDGVTCGDDMTAFDRMRFAFQGQPKAARYDGDSESAPAREPRCTCGHTQRLHDVLRVGACVGGNDNGGRCVCVNYEPDNVRGLNSDPTGSAGIRPDRASVDLKEHDRDARAAAVILERMLARVAKYGPARPASDADRALLAKANVVPEPGCSNCGKHGHWQPIHDRTPDQGVCRFCYEWRRATDSLPAKRECDLHADGKTVRRPDANHIARKASA